MASNSVKRNSSNTAGRIGWPWSLAKDGRTRPARALTTSLMHRQPTAAMRTRPSDLQWRRLLNKILSYLLFLDYSRHLPVFRSLTPACVMCMLRIPKQKTTLICNFLFSNLSETRDILFVEMRLHYLHVVQSKTKGDLPCSTKWIILFLYTGCALGSGIRSDRNLIYVIQRD